MSQSELPKSGRVWRWSSGSGGIEKNIRLNSEPLPKLDPKQHLVRVLAASLNPVDYKPFEIPLVGGLLLRKTIIPGFDMTARIVVPADGSNLKPGTVVYGAASVNPIGPGVLADYVLASPATVYPLSESISSLDASGAPVAAITALQALGPYVKPGDRVFLNGGSGGTGTYAIQIAKSLGLHVTVSCSGRNETLCRELGADEVLDYTKRPILEQLREKKPFDHVVDLVFSDPALYWQSHTYTSPSAKFIEVAGTPSLTFLRFVIGALLLPKFLGGGKRKLIGFGATIDQEALKKVAEMMANGSIKTVRDRVFKMEDVKEAYVLSKSGRARGKILVDVAGEGK